VSGKVRVCFGRESRSKVDFSTKNGFFFELPCSNTLLQRPQTDMAVRYRQGVLVFKISGLYHIPIWRYEQLKFVKKVVFLQIVEPIKLEKLN
jgi:hypothetical protein